MAKDGGNEAGAGQNRQHRCERLTLSVDRELEVAAAATQVQMPAQRPPPQFAAASDRELFANILAGSVARVAFSDQGAAGLIDERLDLTHLTPHDRGDLLMAEILELREQQHAALILRQAANASEELT
jgi:hypothetical protein